MVGSTLVQVSKCPRVLSSSLNTLSHGSSNFLPYLPPRPRMEHTMVRVISAGTGNNQQPSISESNNPPAVVLNIPRNIWRGTLRPPSNFGFGQRSIWEGRVGLFLVSGAVLFALSLAWLRVFQLRSRFIKYQAVFEFAQACGICKGTPVRIRGVTVGNVISLNPSLRSIEAAVEVQDDKIIIPQNPVIELIKRQSLAAWNGE